MKTRKAQAWVVCNKLAKIWKSSLCRSYRLYYSRQQQEVRALLYGSKKWTLAKSTEKQIDGAYTRMLHTALNIYNLEGPHYR